MAPIHNDDQERDEMSRWSTDPWTPDTEPWTPEDQDPADEVVLAVGNAPGEGLRIPAELVPSEYRTDGRLWLVDSVDREDLLDGWW